MMYVIFLKQENPHIPREYIFTYDGGKQLTQVSPIPIMPGISFSAVDLFKIQIKPKDISWVLENIQTHIKFYIDNNDQFVEFCGEEARVIYTEFILPRLE